MLRKVFASEPSLLIYITVPIFKISRSLVAAIVWATTLAAASPGLERRVVLVVWDGMRPDFVSAENTPALWRFAQGGVMFRNHHAIYPSSTEVNGTALATGVYPARSGLIANHDYRPEINKRESIDTENADVVRKGDDLFGGKYLAVPTIAELVRKNGGHTAIASAKTVGLLLDRQFGVARAFKPISDQQPPSQKGFGAPGDANAASITLFKGKALPYEVLNPIVAALGQFPSAAAHSRQDSWTAQALTDFFWKDRLPAFSLLWLSEPDDTQHKTAPAAPAALAAIKSSDENLARILSTLDQRSLRESTDILVVSDHGFSTIERAIDLRKILKKAGFDVATEFKSDPKPGQIMLVGNGGTVLFYVIGDETKVLHRLVEFLQQSDFAGVIFTRDKIEGTFGLDAVRMDGRSVPDVVMSFRWNDSKNQFGIPGMIDADWQRRAGEGTHATLSKFDMHNTLIAAGPDFHRGQIDDLPSGNVDLSPTILEILGIKPTMSSDGRVLVEALARIDNGKQTASATDRALKPATETLEAVKTFPSGAWHQSLKISRVESTVYIDEGNGAFAPKR